MNTEQAIERLDRYIRARYPAIVILSPEEKRVVTAIREMAKSRGKNVIEWAVTTGIVGCAQIDSEGTRDPIAALMAIQSAILDTPTLFIQSAILDTPTLFILRDFHGHLTDPVTIRFVKDVAFSLEQTQHNVIFVSSNFEIPAELDKTLVVMDWPLPNANELNFILARVERNLPAGVERNLNGNREAVVKSLLGLTAFEAENVILSAVVATGKLDESIIRVVVQEKAQVIKRSGILEYYDTSLTLDDVGGLGDLKDYAAVKLSTFTDKALEFGIEPAKGVLLVGVPGTGKSLSAKAIAGGKMPLLRLDIGAVMGSLVGQSESNMRQALKIAEAISPCVLWVDEIEKGLGGVSGGESDGGTTKRVFGTFLTWMSEKTAPVYVIATANDVRSLPAELFRAGRFDDIFFVDLPCADDRENIFRVHLERRGRRLSDFSEGELSQIVSATWGFTGAEIEKVVTSAIERAFFAGREVGHQDFITAARQVNPISRTMKENIDNLRGWAKTRALSAGVPLEAAPSKDDLWAPVRTVEL